MGSLTECKAAAKRRVASTGIEQVVFKVEGGYAVSGKGIFFGNNFVLKYSKKGSKIYIHDTTGKEVDKIETKASTEPIKKEVTEEKGIKKSKQTKEV